MSISMLVISISMLALFVCSSAVSALTSPTFIYNKSDQSETVYTLDPTGKWLTPKMKYEFSKDSINQSEVKVAYRWNAETNAWTPAYQLAVSQTATHSEVAYAAWDNQTKNFTAHPQKAVYNKNLEGELSSYISYRWNQTSGNWVINQHLLFEEYFAMNPDDMN